MRRTKEDALETRKKLLESALNIMTEKSYSVVSMSEIARRVGLSKGAVYWHFRNKEYILVALLEYLHEELLEIFSLGRLSLETLDDLKHYFENKISSLTHDERSRKIHKLMNRREEWPAVVRKKAFSMLLEAREYEREAIEKMLEISIERGLVRNDIRPRELSQLFSGVFLGIFLLNVGGFYESDLVQQHIGFMFDAFEKELDPENVVQQNHNQNSKGRCNA